MISAFGVEHTISKSLAQRMAISRQAARAAAKTGAVVKKPPMRMSAGDLVRKPKADMRMSASDLVRKP